MHVQTVKGINTELGCYVKEVDNLQISQNCQKKKSLACVLLHLSLTSDNENYIQSFILMQAIKL